MAVQWPLYRRFPRQPSANSPAEKRSGLMHGCAVSSPTLCAALLAVAGACSAQSPPAAPNPLLTTAPQITRTLSARTDTTERLAYQQVAELRIAIPAGSAAVVLLEQQEGAINATWLAADSTAHDTRRNDMGRGAQIRFTLVPPGEGDSSIRFLCTTKTTPCTVRVKSDGPRVASDEDRLRMAAEELLAHGNAVHRSPEKDARAGAFAIYDQVIAEAQSLGDLPLERAALYWRTRLSMELQKYSDALASAQKMVALAGAEADPQGAAAAYKVLGYANAYLGNLDAAIEAYGQAAEIYSTTGDRLNKEILEENMARAHRAMGQNGKAIEEVTAALAEARAIQDGHGITASLEELGNLYFTRGELQPALDTYKEALDALATWPDETLHAHVLNGIGHVDTLLGEYDDAKDHLEQSVALWRKIKDPMGEAYALDGEGFLAFTTHDYATAIQRIREALDLVTGLHLERESAIIREELGEAEQASGDVNAANEAFQQSLATAKKLHLAATEADCMRSLGEAAAAHGDAVTARADFQLAEQLYEPLGGSSNQALLEGDEANLEHAQGNLPAAEAHMEKALAII